MLTKAVSPADEKEGESCRTSDRCPVILGVGDSPDRVFKPSNSMIHVSNVNNGVHCLNTFMALFCEHL